MPAECEYVTPNTSLASKGGLVQAKLTVRTRIPALEVGVPDGFGQFEEEPFLGQCMCFSFILLL